MFKKIHDERLLAKNLRNVRIAFLVETLGVAAVLVYIGVAEGVRAVSTYPLFGVLLLTVIVYLVLSLPISREVEQNLREAQAGSWVPSPRSSLEGVSGVLQA